MSLPLEPPSHLRPHATPLGHHRAQGLSSLHQTVNSHWLFETYKNRHFNIVVNGYGLHSWDCRASTCQELLCRKHLIDGVNCCLCTQSFRGGRWSPGRCVTGELSVMCENSVSGEGQQRGALGRVFSEEPAETETCPQSGHGVGVRDGERDRLARGR